MIKPREWWAKECRLERLRNTPEFARLSDEEVAEYAPHDINWNYFKVVEKHGFDYLLGLLRRGRRAGCFAGDLKCEVEKALEEFKKLELGAVEEYK